MAVESPSPFVYWAQDVENIFLKVDLKDAKDENIHLDDNKLVVSATGVGAHGQTIYSFSLNFFADLDTNDDVHTKKVTDRAIQFVLKKCKNSWWPRLIKHQQKPAWLKVDFERWKSEEDDFPDSNSAYSLEGNDIIGDYPELYEKLKKEEFGYIKEDFKKVYVIFYNFAQFLFFSYILIVVGVRYAKDGADSMLGTYEAIGPVLKFAQLVQYLEVMHPMFGYTKGKPLVSFMQITGRAIVLFGMIEAEPRMQTKPVIFYLTIIWSLVEVVRYPYYIADTYKRNFKLLTWLRYTIWIPLYPLGALCEGIIILRNIPYFEETGKFIVVMPNSWNVTFHTPTIMKLYLLLLLFPGIYAVMSHMYRARLKKLGPKKWKRK